MAKLVAISGLSGSGKFSLALGVLYAEGSRRYLEALSAYTVENALAKVTDEKGMKRVEKFLKQGVCPDCGGTRLNKQARSTLLCDLNLPSAAAMTLETLVDWTSTVPATLPEPMQSMAESIAGQFQHIAKRLTG